MSQKPTHEEMQGILASDTVPVVSGPEWERLCAHLAECEACRSDLAELYPDLTWPSEPLPGAAMDRARSQRVRARLLARAIAEAADISGEPNPGVRTARASPRRRASTWTGWAVAAGMAGLLLTHHAFHRPLELGWIAAATLALLLVGVGVYAMVQREQTAALRDQLAAERRRQAEMHFPADPDRPIAE
jgi:hypothetical protein